MISMLKSAVEFKALIPPHERCYDCLAKFISLCLVLLSFNVAEGAQTSAKQPMWAQISSEQQKILAPLAGEWDRLPDYQRQRILVAAKRYPQMTPEQQRRFSSRLREWSHLTLEQRNLARSRFREFQSLPPKKQAEIKKRWQESNVVQKTPQTEEAPSPQPGAADKQYRVLEE